jgi:hypothetical protein
VPTYTPTILGGAIPGAGYTPSTINGPSGARAQGAQGIALIPGRNLSVGVSKEVAEGNPGTPCLVLKYPGMWRFRWAVTAGARTIRVDCKQAYNAADYPSIIVKASSFGPSSDVTATSGGGTGWVTIGPASFTATGTGVVWVELWNNLKRNDAPCYFDHIITT